MRLLKFIVDGQQITKDPECDFNNLVSGTSGYLRAKFTFPPECGDCVKVARFRRGSKEYAEALINDECDIPAEVLVGATFKVGVVMQCGTSRIPTNDIQVRQEVSR